VDNETRHIELNLAKWNHWARSLDRMGFRTKYLKKAQHDVVALLDIRDGVRFLDVGCGPGWALEEAAKRAGGSGEFYGVDLSPLMIEKAKADYAGKSGFHFLVANAESIPLEAGSFDTVICTSSFHHYLHPDKALGEFHRLLKAGGKLYILDPTADSFVVRLVDRIGRWIEPEHVKLYSSAEFQEMFERTGLRYSSMPSGTKAHTIHVGTR